MAMCCFAFLSNHGEVTAVPCFSGRENSSANARFRFRSGLEAIKAAAISAQIRQGQCLTI